MRLQAALITTTSSYNSFFVELSRKVSERLSLYVYAHPKDSLYYVIAYIPKPLAWDSISDVMKVHRENIIRIFRYAHTSETYLVTVKQCCDFYELIEDYNVVISMPYTIYKGRRVYCVYGDGKDVNRYTENVVAKYGRKNVVIRKADPITCISYQMRNIVSSYTFTILTEKEKQLLIKAFESGYISSRRRISLEELAEALSITKPTASLMLRKAIEKIVRRLIVAESA